MQKRLIILRGLPGCGKSDAARSLFGEESVCENDTFRYQEGLYVYDPDDNERVAQACADLCERKMQIGNPTVVVANTFTMKWEMEPYLILANKYGYKVRILNMYDGGLTDAELAAATKHGVPVDRIAIMRARFEELPCERSLSRRVPVDYMTRDYYRENEGVLS